MNCGNYMTECEDLARYIERDRSKYDDISSSGTLLFVLLESSYQKKNLSFICKLLTDISFPIYFVPKNRFMESSVVHPPSTLAVSTTSTVTATKLESSSSSTMVICAMPPTSLPLLPTSSLLRFTTWVPWVTSRFLSICLRWVSREDFYQYKRSSFS